MNSQNDDETASSDCSCPPLISSSQSDDETADETASSDSSRPPLMEDYQYETYIFKLLKLDRPLIRETFDSWANDIVKLMRLDRQFIRETFDSWATTFRAIDDSA